MLDVFGDVMLALCILAALHIGVSARVMLNVFGGVVFAFCLLAALHIWVSALAPYDETDPPGDGAGAGDGDGGRVCAARPAGRGSVAA